MTQVLWLIIGIYGLTVAGWWARHVLISLTRTLDLQVAPSPGDEGAPRISVVIAARDERERIGACITSLLTQGPVVREVIVVDDRSTDGMAEVVVQSAGGDPRVRVLRVDELPAGWRGKAHACHVGGEAAQCGWLLFADADCRFLPGGVGGAVRYAERKQVDLLSLWLRADHRSFWEHMLIPLCGALILYWFPPLWANRPRTRLAWGNGQFILVRREAYRRIGGHACSRQAVIEDIPLAAHAKRSGLRLRMAVGADIAAVRMYTHYAEVRDGWTRIFIGALQRPWKLLVSAWSLIGGSLLPCIGAPVAAGVVAGHGWPASSWTATMIVLLWLHAVAVGSVSYRLWGLCRCNRYYLWLYPVSTVAVLVIVLRAWWWMVTRRPIIWRGTPTGPQSPETILSI